MKNSLRWFFLISLFILFSSAACGATGTFQLSEKPEAVFETLVDVEGYENGPEIWVDSLQACSVTVSTGLVLEYAELTASEGQIKIQRTENGLWEVYAEEGTVDFKRLDALNCAEEFAFEIMPLNAILSGSGSKFEVNTVGLEFQSFRIQRSNMITTEPILACNLRVDGETPVGYEYGVRIVPEDGSEVSVHSSTGKITFAADGMFYVEIATDHSCSTLIPEDRPSLFAPSESEKNMAIIYVVDSSGNTISNAEVQLVIVGSILPTQRTDSGGKVIFQNVQSSSDDAQVHVAAPGYESSWQNVSLSQLVGQLPMHYQLEVVPSE